MDDGSAGAVDLQAFPAGSRWLARWLSALVLLIGAAAMAQGQANGTGAGGRAPVSVDEAAQRLEEVQRRLATGRESPALVAPEVTEALTRREHVLRRLVDELERSSVADQEDTTPKAVAQTTGLADLNGAGFAHSAISESAAGRPGSSE